MSQRGCARRRRPRAAAAAALPGWLGAAGEQQPMACRRLQRMQEHVATTSSVGGSRSSGERKQDWQPQPFRTVVALVESTTAGGSSTSPDRCWVAQLSQLIGTLAGET